MTAEWKLTYEEANQVYKEAPTKGQGKMAIADAAQKKLLKYLISAQYEELLKAMLKDSEEGK
jgi:hypothetical protein